MAQWLRPLSPQEDQSSDPNTRIKQFTTTCNISSKGSDAFSDPYGHSMHVCSHMHTDAHMYNKS